MASTKKSRFGTKGGKRSKRRGKKRGHGRRLSTAARAKLSRKGKARWRRMSAAQRAYALRGIKRFHKGGKKRKGKKGKKHRRTGGSRDVGHLVARAKARRFRRRRFHPSKVLARLKRMMSFRKHRASPSYAASKVDWTAIGRQAKADQEYV